MTWNVRQFAKETGISPDTLRFYEKENVLVPPRKENNYRSYGEYELMLAKYIVVMRYAGFTLAEVRALNDIFVAPASSANNENIKQILVDKANIMQKTITNYQAIMLLMQKLLPMIDTLEACLINQPQINKFISQLHQDVLD
jgi:MerR family Zn(II)-responsive transcriptional regulator of zntA